jgi:tetratricopeptide (TPR) repeat protein
LQRVQNLITDKRFKLAMTKAYQALFTNRYQSARAAFAEALKIKPGDAAAARALQQALASDQTSSISSLLANARQYEQQEEWASAQSNYQTVLQRDANQVSAKLGNIRSSARLTLDQQLEEVLTDKLALSRSEPRAKAERVLQDARAIPDQGPRLKRQITQLESALTQLDTVVRVSLRSDNLTQVALQKVGSKAIQLGTFAEKNLSLKPGRYIATGVRLGYQDVRKEIELLPGDGDLQVFDVRCDQAISDSIGA